MCCWNIEGRKGLTTSLADDVKDSFHLFLLSISLLRLTFLTFGHSILIIGCGSLSSFHIPFFVLSTWGSWRGVSFPSFSLATITSLVLSNSFSLGVYIPVMMRKTLGFPLVPISLMGTPRSIRKQTDAMILQLFASRSRGMISKTLHLCSYMPWGLKISNLGWKNNQMTL